MFTSLIWILIGYTQLDTKIFTNSIVQRFSSCLVPNHSCLPLIADSNSLMDKNKEVNFFRDILSGAREEVNEWIMKKLPS